MSKIFNIETGPNWDLINKSQHILVQNGDRTLVSTDREVMFDEKQSIWVLVEDNVGLSNLNVEFHYPELHKGLQLHPEYKTKIWRR